MLKKSFYLVLKDIRNYVRQYMTTFVVFSSLHNHLWREKISFYDQIIIHLISAAYKITHINYYLL
jgi:hypothetical protein